MRWDNRNLSVWFNHINLLLIGVQHGGFEIYFHTISNLCSHQAKANAKAKKINGQSEKIKENFRFCSRVRFRLVWTGPNTINLLKSMCSHFPWATKICQFGNKFEVGEENKIQNRKSTISFEIVLNFLYRHINLLIKNFK